MGIGGYLIIALIIFALIVMIRCIVIVPKAHVYVVESLCTFK